MPTTNCPSLENLRSFSAGRLALNVCEQIASHLEDCSDCQSRLETISAGGDTMISVLRGVGDVDDGLDSGVRQVLDRIQAIGRDPSFHYLPTAGEGRSDGEARAAAGEIVQADLGTIHVYRLLAKLGEGGMGTVYKALHTRLEKIVALKVLPAERMNPAAVARFEREMRAVGKLQHPNIVGAHDAGVYEGRHFLVMEYVAGHDLSEVVRRLGPLPIAEACEIVRQAAIALQHAHEHGLVHRDIKPSNLMLTTPLVRSDRIHAVESPLSPGGRGAGGEGALGPLPGGREGAQPTVKVLDFGLALLQESHEQGQELTGASQMMGTADYVAPEQAGDSHTVDVRADIYSLGCTLYKLLTGEAPYQGAEFNTPLKKMMAHVGRALPDARKLRPEVPDALLAVLRRMTAKQPADRYATPAEAAAAVAPFAAAADLPALAARLSPSPLAVAAGLVPAAAAGLVPAAREPAGSIDPTLPAAGTDPHLSSSLLDTDHGAVAAGLVPAGDSVGNALRGVPSAALDPAGLASSPPRFTRRQQTALAAAAGFLLVAFGIWVIFRDRDGNETGRQRLADGGSIIIQDDGAPPADEPMPPANLPLPSRERAGVRGQPVESPVDSPDSDTPPVRHSVDAAFVAAVARLPAAEQVAAVAGKLQELNPGFDGQVRHLIENGEVVHLTLVSDQVTDISPVRALADLRSLTCAGTYAGEGPLEDLSPLAGLLLTTLDCAYTQVSDLSPLAGMPLTSLYCSGTRVSDLAPLAGMSLTYLACLFTPVSDLSPLEGMPLASLHCGNTAVSDLAPLAGTPLTILDCYNTRVSDLSPLARLPLANLNCGATRVTDLSPLTGMPLTTLLCNGTQVSDLSPLAGLGLTHLDFSATRVSDLSPLAGLPLTILDCTATQVSDLSPLAGMPIPTLGCDFRLFHADDERIVRSLPLESCNGLAVAEFWKQVEARRKSSDDLALAVAGLAPSEQVQAVRKRLLELNRGLGPALRYGTETEAVTEASLTFPVVNDAIDLTPLRALATLRKLTLRGVGPAADLSPLSGLPLEELTCDAQALPKNAPILRGIAALKTINGQPPEAALSAAPRGPAAAAVAAESEIDPQFLAAVAALPAEDQVVAVAKKLAEVNAAAEPIAMEHTVVDGQVVALGLSDSRIVKLWPVAALRSLPRLVLIGTTATDLSPLSDYLAELQSIDLRLTLYNRAGENVLRNNIPSLATINGQPTAEFWAARDAHRKEIEDLPKQIETYRAAGLVFTAEQQIEIVRRKLRELNPGYDGELTYVAEGADVTGVDLSSAGANPTRASLWDISPVRGLQLLTSVGFGGTRVSDLSPLSEMRLSDIVCGGTLVADLSPIAGMELTSLDCRFTPVSDFSPLVGMPLTTLLCYGTRVADLAPLARMKLTTLFCGATSVSDLSPLAGMPLTTLGCEATPVTDLSPLKGMLLGYLSCNNTSVSDLSPLTGMPLATLHGGGTAISDVSALRGMPLVILDFSQTSVSDLSPLAGMPLTQLLINGTRVSNLEPLKGMPLEHLYIYDTPVNDLAPLEGMPLTLLFFERTAVADLAPLKGMSVRRLYCGSTPISDLAPLAGMPLEELLCDGTDVTDLSALAGSPLYKLNLHDTDVDDGALAQLKGLTGLGNLYLTGTRVTAAGVARLQAALPGCKIEWSPPEAAPPAP